MGKTNPAAENAAIEKYKHPNIYLAGVFSPNGNFAAIESDQIKPAIVPATDTFIKNAINKK